MTCRKSKVEKATTVISRLLVQGKSPKQIKKALTGKRVGLTERGANTYYYNIIKTLEV